MGIFAGYVRLSRDEDARSYGSIIEQKNIIIDYYKKILNYQGQVTFFEDDDESGFNFNRPGLLELGEQVKGHNVEVLVVKDLSRLGRKGWKTEQIYENFVDDYGIRIIAINDGHDSHNAASREIMGIHTWTNERYVRDISKKVLSSFRSRQSRGELIINVPYGYIKDQNNSSLKCKIIIDEYAALTVRRIYQLYIEGNGYRKIAAIMNKEGSLTPSAYKNRSNAQPVWNSQVVKNILTNEFYTGTLIQGKTYKKKIKGRSYLTPSNQLLKFQDNHEAIINRDTFCLVQHIAGERSLRKIKGRRCAGMHIFTGKIYCNKCNKTYVYRCRKSQSEGYYICSSQYKMGVAYCKNASIPENKLVNYIRDKVNSIILKEKQSILKLLGQRIDKQNSIERHSPAQESINKEILKREKIIAKIYRDRLNGKIPQNILESILNQSILEITKLQHQLQIYQDTYRSQNNQCSVKAEAKEAVVSNFLNIPFSRKAIELFIDKIIVDDRQEKVISVYWNV